MVGLIGISLAFDDGIQVLLLSIGAFLLLFGYDVAFEVLAGGRDAGEHGAQIAGDGDFRHRILNRAILHPESGRAARIIPRHGIHALAHQFSEQQP